MLNIQVTNTLSDTDINYIESRWNQLAKAYNIPKSKAENIFDQIRFEYSDWNRAYHNLSHLWSLLQLRAQYAEQLENPMLIDFAIFFHDLIYNAKRKDNELKSADMAKTLVARYLPKEEMQFVYDLIMSTAGHKPKIEDSSDQLWFLDFDLAVLAAEKETYKAYAEGIKEEYKTWYSFLVYNSGRKDVLKTFLKRKRLYFTEEFYGNYEEKARANIEWEIQDLKES
jgi:predicted metal-dependent HD superfamily phosphohydrolase